MGGQTHVHFVFKRNRSQGVSQSASQHAHRKLQQLVRTRTCLALATTATTTASWRLVACLFAHRHPPPAASCRQPAAEVTAVAGVKPPVGVSLGWLPTCHRSKRVRSCRHSSRHTYSPHHTGRSRHWRQRSSGSMPSCTRNQPGRCTCLPRNHICRLHHKAFSR